MLIVFFSSRRRHTRCALVTGVQTCALPISADLAGDPLTAARQVTWTVVADGAGYALEARNPTPYHITFSKLSLIVDNVAYAPDNGMVAPLSSLRLPVRNLGHAPAAGRSEEHTSELQSLKRISYAVFCLK